MDASPFASQLPESVIKRLSIRVKELGGINLGQGIPSFPTAKHICDAAGGALGDADIGVYPNFLGTLELRQAIAQRLSKDHDREFDAQKHILVSVGAMEGSASTILSLVGTDERVGILTPDYCNHFPEVLLARGKICEIPLVEADGWKLDLPRIEREAKKGMKLLLFTNPNNPVGSVLSRKSLEALVALAKKYDFWIMADETYAFLSYDTAFVSLLDFWDSYNRLIAVRSFSKEYAMTGWRVGYVVAQPDVIKLIAKTHDALVGCVPKISQIAATTAICGPQDVVTSYKKAFVRRRGVVCARLNELSDYLTYIAPAGSYYVFPKYRKKISSVALSEQILSHMQVGVVPGSVFGQAGEGHIRISFAVDDTVLKDGMDRLEKFFKRV